VLGPDVVVLQRPRFVLRENDDLASTSGKTLKRPAHPGYGVGVNSATHSQAAAYPCLLPPVRRCIDSWDEPAAIPEDLDA